MSLSISKILTMSPSDETVSVRGWVRTRRSSKNVSFVALNDGSTIRNLQLVIDIDKGYEGMNEETIAKITTGASLIASGKLVASQEAAKPSNCCAKKSASKVSPTRRIPAAAQETFTRILARNRPSALQNQCLRRNSSRAPCNDFCHSQVFQRPWLL